MGNKEKQFDAFVKAMEGSRAGVARVADWLSGMGKSVVMCGQSIAPDLQSTSEYSDHGDLFILKRLEVKHLSAEFTGAHDWPFGRHFITTAKHSFDKISKESDWPEAFIAINKSMTHAGVVNVRETRKDWYAEERNDPIFDGNKLYYFCPTSKVTWHKMI